MVDSIPFEEALSIAGAQKLDKEEVNLYVRDQHRNIVEAKGATHYGIATIVKRLCESIFRNSLDVRAVSHYVEEYDVCMSLPCVIGREGVIRTMKPVLAAEEMEKLKSCGKSLKSLCQKYQ